MTIASKGKLAVSFFTIVISITAVVSTAFSWAPTDLPVYNFEIQTEGLGYQLRNEQLGTVYDVASDEDGNIYVLHSYFFSEFSFSGVSVFNSNGDFISKWEGVNNGDSDTSNVTSIAASNGYVYIANNNSWEIKIFTTAGTYVSKFGGHGSDDGEFNYLTKVEVANNSIYVVDQSINRVQKFDLNGNYQAQVGGLGSGNGQLHGPSGITIGSNSDVYVHDDGNDRVQIFDSNLAYKSQWPVASPRDSNTDITFGADGNIYMIKSLFVRKYSTSGTLIDTFGESGNRVDKIAYSYSISANSRGVLVGDANGRKVLLYDYSGEYVESIGYSVYGGPGQVNFVEGIAGDSEGNFYVAEGEPDDGSENYRIQKFSSKGEYISQFGQWGDEDGYFKWVSGIGIDNDDNIYVSDCEKNVVQKFDNDGNYLMKFGGSTLSCPKDIAVNAEGMIFVVDSGNSRVAAFRPNGTFINSLSSWDGGYEQLSVPEGIAATPARLTITDSDMAQMVYIGINQTWGLDDEFIRVLYGNGSSPFTSPTDVAYFNVNGQNNYLLVVDSGRNRVEFADIHKGLTGIWPIWNFGTVGSGTYQFSSPRQIAISQDSFLVHDEGNSRLISYTLDTTPPAITLNPLSNGYYRNILTLAGNALDAAVNVTSVQYQVDSTSGIWSNCSAQDGSFNSKDENFSCSLSGIPEGEHTIYVRSSDSRNNTSVGAQIKSTTYKADRTVPTGSLSINDGQELTESRNVALTVSAADNYSGIDQMVISEDVTFTDVPWVAYATSTEFRLSEGVEEKTLYIKFSDVAGNQSAIYTSKIFQNSTELNPEVITTVEETTITTTTPSTDNNGSNNGGTSANGVGEGSPIVVLVNGALADISRSIQNLPITSQTSESVSGVAIITAFATASAGLLIGLSSPLVYLMQGSSAFFAFLRIRKKKQGTSVVYDSVTKEPIVGAIVRIFKLNGELARTEVTDAYGSIDPSLERGRYKVSVSASGFRFPSSGKFAGTDGVYESVYNGGEIEYSSGMPFTISIPVDPIGLSKSATIMLKIRAVFAGILSLLPIALISGGSVFSVISYAKNPTTGNLVLLFSYVLLLGIVIYSLFGQRSGYGQIKDTEGNPVSGLTLSLSEVKYGRVVAQRVTNEKGFFRFVVPAGQYRLAIQDSRYKLTDENMLIVESRSGKSLIINQNIKVKAL